MAQAKIKAKEPSQIENPKGQSRQKLKEETMGMAKFPEGTSWAKITWQRKKKRKRKKQRNEMTINKDNKKVILLLHKLKVNKIFFIGDLEHSNPLLNLKTKM